MTRVLVVDDEPDYPQLLSIILSKEGFDVKTAAEGREACEIAEQFVPDVLVIDWILDGAEDGLDVIKTIRGFNASLQAVLITGYPSATLESRVANIPSVRFLTKPFTPSRLVELIREAAEEA